MPVVLHAPPLLTYQDGLPPFSAQRASLTHSPGVNANHDSNSNAPRLSSPSRAAPSANAAVQSTSPHPTPAGDMKASASFVLQQEQRGSPNSQRRINTRVWTERADVPSASHAFDTASLSSSASSSSSSVHPSMQPTAHQRHVRSNMVEGNADSSRRLDVTTQDFENTPLSPMRLNRIEALSSGAGMIAVPLPVLVEQQKQRIHELVHERDTFAEELRELRELFRRLSDDYDGATRELEARQLRLDSLQTEQRVTQEELMQARALNERHTHRIKEFETEWGDRTGHLRTQLDALTQERDAVQSQRDVCMSENSDLRRQLVQLQGELYRVDVQQRESLREQASAHAQELRAALQEKDEQLQTRVAATRHEARLTQQQLSQLGTSQAAAQEDREALRWRLAELESVVDKKEHLRSELARMVASLRAQVMDQEHQARGDAQRYAQRAQELEQTYQAQLNQEQHRCQALQEELAGARRALQEAHRQHQVLEETHAAHTRDITARYAKQEDELREQLRSTRIEWTESQALAAQHEAAAHRRQREAEALRASAASQQEERTKLHEAQSAQTQQLLRAEGRVEILKTRLQEKEREAELLRCTLEQTAWTSEMRNAMQHTLATVFDVPRAMAMKWLQKKDVSLAELTTPQLEWQAHQRTPQSTPPKSKPQAQQPKEHADASPTQETADRAHVAAAPLPSQTLAPSHQQGVLDNNDTHDHEMPGAAADSFRSPLRSVSASAQAATVQHVETIERTAARSVASPISVLKSSHSYAPPPLHPGTGTVMAPPAAAAAGVAVPRSTLLALSRPSPTTAADASVTLSPSSTFFRRTLSFTSAHAPVNANAASQHTPSRARHQYNVAADEDGEQREEEAGDAGDGLIENSLRAAPRRGGGDCVKHAARNEEVFFDDFCSPVSRRDASQRRMMSVPMTTPMKKASTRSSSVGPRAASAQPAHPSSSALVSTPRHGTPSGRGSSKLQATPGAGRGQPGSAAAAPSIPGARAAELLTQLPPYSPAAAAAATAASITSTPFSSASAMVARQRHADHMNDDEDGLQQYLRETVQQVLAGQRSDLLQRHQIQPPPLSSSVPQQGLRGHSHYTQLYDGSVLHSAHSRVAGEEDEVEEDFGSVSRPRSVLSVLPGQQRMALTRQVNDTAAPAAVNGSQGRYNSSRGLAQERVRSSPAANIPAATSATTNPNAFGHAVHTPAKASTRGPTSQTEDRVNRRVEAGVADTLEQLARRQQQLLRSLGSAAGAAAFPNTSPSSADVGEDGARGYPRGREELGQPSSQARLSTETEVGGPLRNTLSTTTHTDLHHPQEFSDITSSDVVLDPRQLSYATASTTFAAHAPEVDADANGRRVGSGPLAAQWQALTLSFNRQEGSGRETNPSHDTHGKRNQREYRNGGAPSHVWATSLSAPSLSVSASDAKGPLRSASSGDTAERGAALPARPDSLSSASGPQETHSAPPSSGKLPGVSETRLHDAAAGTAFAVGAARSTSEEGGTAGVEEKATMDFPATATGTTATALTSVSEVSSLSQLERQLAHPFTQ